MKSAKYKKINISFPFNRKNSEDNPMKTGNYILVNLLFIVLTAALMFVIMWLSYSAFSNIFDNSKKNKDDISLTSLNYSFEYGEYGKLYDSACYIKYYYNDFNDIDVDKRDYCLFAYYYNEAVLYHAYEEANDTVKMEECRKNMQEYYNKITHRLFKDTISKVNENYSIPDSVIS